MDGGRVTTVTYPSQDPIAKTLRSFQVDITANPPTIAGNLAIAQAIVASLQAQIALGLEVPTASVQLAAIASAYRPRR